MIILDTNVVSELMRGPAASPTLVKWIKELPEPPVTTILTRAELMAGLALLAPGRKRDALAAAAAQILGRVGVCLPLTTEAADRYGEIVAVRQGAGRPIGTMDALIAATALECGGTVATRDVGGFAGLGLKVVNPWGT